MASWRRLGGILEVPEGILKVLGGFLEGLRAVLETSWTCLGENVEKRSRGGKNRYNSSLKCNLLFLAILNIFFVIFHVFESQLVRTCSRKNLAKHWLGAQKLTRI